MIKFMIKIIIGVMLTIQRCFARWANLRTRILSLSLSLSPSLSLSKLVCM